jgi:hypothetical protein
MMADMLDQAIHWLLEQELETYQRGDGYPPKLIGRVEDHVVMAGIDAYRSEPTLSIYCGPDVIEWFEKAHDTAWIAATYEGDSSDFDGYGELVPPECGTVENPLFGDVAHPCVVRRQT